MWAPCRPHKPCYQCGLSCLCNCVCGLFMNSCSMFVHVAYSSNYDIIQSCGTLSEPVRFNELQYWTTIFLQTSYLYPNTYFLKLSSTISSLHWSKEDCLLNCRCLFPQWLSEDCKATLRERIDRNENLTARAAPELHNIPARTSCSAVPADSTLEGSSNCPFTQRPVDDPRFFPSSFMYAVCCEGGCVGSTESQPCCQPLLSTKTVLLQTGPADNCEQEHFEERILQLPFACVCALQ